MMPIHCWVEKKREWHCFELLLSTMISGAIGFVDKSNKDNNQGIHPVKHCGRTRKRSTNETQQQQIQGFSNSGGFFSALCIVGGFVLLGGGPSFNLPRRFRFKCSYYSQFFFFVYFLFQLSVRTKDYILIRSVTLNLFIHLLAHNTISSLYFYSLLETIFHPSL